MVESARVQVLDNRTVGETTHIIALSKPPGFTHTPGQFIVLQLEVEGKPVRRSYSIASGPGDDRIEIAVRSQPHGRASPVICGLSVGATMSLLGPYGRFIISDDAPALLIGAGTGVTPFISYFTSADDLSGHTYLASHRTPEQVLYPDVVDEAAQKGLRSHVTITRPGPNTKWEGLTGRIDAKLLGSTLGDIDSYVAAYICGPTPMVVSVSKALEEIGMPKARIITEKYGDIQA